MEGGEANMVDVTDLAWFLDPGLKDQCGTLLRGRK
jgi:hypothetical protein